MFWQILPSIVLYVWFLQGFDLCTINLLRRMRLFEEILLPSLGLIKHFYYVINLLYYEHWTVKRKYISYIAVTLKVIKSSKRKMTTLAHDVCDVHGASSLYIKTCWQKFFYILHTHIYTYRIFPTGGIEGTPQQIFSHPPLFLHHKNFIQPNKKIKVSLLAVVITLVPFLFYFHTLLTHNSC